jgi:hypothetical protein
MYQKIKELADAAVKLQNKIAMENTLKEIGSMCDKAIKAKEPVQENPKAGQKQEKPAKKDAKGE